MHYNEQIAALRRVFKPMGTKAATLLNFLRVAESPLARLEAAEKIFPGKGLTTVDNLLTTGIRPYLNKVGIVVRNEIGKGWYLLPGDRARLTTLMEALPPQPEPKPAEVSGDDRQRITVYLRAIDLVYFTSAARIRNVTPASLARRLIMTIARDQMVEAILDDAGDYTKRIRYDHKYKQPVE